MRITQKRILKWKKEGNVEKLLIALKDVMYNNRILAAEALADFEENNVADALVEATNDKVPTVVNAAVKSLENFTLSESQTEILKKYSIAKKEADEEKKNIEIKRFALEVEKFSNSDLIVKSEDSDNIKIKEACHKEIEIRGGISYLKNKIIKDYQTEISKYFNRDLIKFYNNTEKLYNDSFQKLLAKEIDARGGFDKVELEAIREIVKSFQAHYKALSYFFRFFDKIKPSSIQRVKSQLGESDIKGEPLMTASNSIGGPLLLLTDSTIYIVGKKLNKKGINSIALRDLKEVTGKDNASMLNTDITYMFNGKYKFDVAVDESIFQEKFPKHELFFFFKTIKNHIGKKGV